MASMLEPPSGQNMELAASRERATYVNIINKVERLKRHG